MNQGKRYLRNTVLGLYGTAALFVGLNRLYASTLDTQTPQWLRNTLTLGLTAHPEPQPVPEMTPTDLAALRDFNNVQVSGEFKVEIVGAATYKVTYFPAVGSKGQIRVRQVNDLLSLRAAEDERSSDKGVLRIEMPTLSRLVARDVSQLTLRGLQAEEVNVSLHNVAAARLQQNQVAHWKVYSDEPLEMPVDAATLAAGSLQTRGNLSIRYGAEAP